MKIRFLTPLDVRAKMDGTWTLLNPLDVDLGLEGILSVPADFNTDLASVPRLFWNILPPFGAYEEAAVAHDWLYRNAGRVEVIERQQPRPTLFSRAGADAVFLAGMIACDVPVWQRSAIYRAVRLFGGPSFRKVS